MSWIGIEDNRGLIYEGGSSSFGHALWPTPVITPAKIVYESEGALTAESSGASPTQTCRFREDYYDPTARIKRGRFYSAEGTQPKEWFVQPHPAYPLEANDVIDNLGVRKNLKTYQSIAFMNRFMAGKNERPQVLLGLDDRFTIWTVINVEGIAHGEDIVTLKARNSFGVLPEINYDEVPSESRTLVKESINGFLDEVYRSAPVSVIDRARDTASQLLLAHYQLKGKEAKDLGHLAKKLEQDKKSIAANAAKIIARLHARAKPSERHKREMPAIKEQNAQLATECLGVLISEIGWNK